MKGLSGINLVDGLGCHESTATAVVHNRVSLRTILVVDDEEIVRDFSASVLRDCGYNVVTAANGEEALALSSSDLPGFSLLFTDVVMPGMSGVELAEKFREKCPDVEVLFTSGYVQDELTDKAVHRSSANFIQKPFGVDELTAKISEVMKRHA